MILKGKKKAKYIMFTDTLNENNVSIWDIKNNILVYRSNCYGGKVMLNIKHSSDRSPLETWYKDYIKQEELTEEQVEAFLFVYFL